MACVLPCCSTSPAKTTLLTESVIETATVLFSIWPNAVVVGKSTYFQFTVKMYFLQYQTVQFNFFSALTLSKKKKNEQSFS